MPASTWHLFAQRTRKLFFALSFFFYLPELFVFFLWDSSTEIFLGKRGFFHTCRTPAMPHKKNLIIAFVAQCLFKPSQWVQRTNECLPEAVFQTLESEGDFNQPGAKLCAFYCRVVDNGKPPWAAWKEDTRFTDLYLLLTKKKKRRRGKNRILKTSSVTAVCVWKGHYHSILAYQSC